MRVGLVLARLQLRHGWRALVSVTVLVAIAGSLTLAAIAGARRTGSALDRMVSETEALDLLVNPDRGDDSALVFEDIAALPMVEEASRVHGMLLLPAPPVESVADLDGAPVVMITDGGFLYDYGRPVLTDGRLPTGESVDEVYVDANYADEAGIVVGDRLSYRVADHEEMGELWASTSETEALGVVNRADFGTIAELTVVGIGHNLDAIVIDEGFEPLPMWAPSGLAESLDAPDIGFWGATVRLSDPDRVEELTAAVNALVPDELVVYATRAATERKIGRAVAPSVTALRIFAGVSGALGLLVVGQAVSRRFRVDGADNEVYAVLGATHRHRFAASMTRLGVIAVTGAGFALMGAWLLSWLMPVGPARRAEVDPGLSFDAPVLLGSGTAVVVAVVAVGAWPCWRAASRVPRQASSRQSTLARWVSSLGAPTQVTTGIRFALEPGRGASAVPTRATVLGAATAIAVAVATVVFSASVDRVVGQARFYGTNFDIQIQFFGDVVEDDADARHVLDVISGDPAVRSAGEVRVSEIRASGYRLSAIAFAGGDGRIGPTIARGRAPERDDEIALGANTMRDLGVEIGDTLPVVAPAFDGEARIVGQAVLPGVGLYQGSDRTALGTGAVVPASILGPRDLTTKSVFVAALDDGESASSLSGETARQLVELGEADIREPDVPSDIRSLAELRSLPITLAGLLTVLVAAAVVHSMAIAVRRRARELAVLRVLGAKRRTVRQVGVWQGVTIGGSAALIGLPAGLAVGRWSWAVLADAFGTLAEPVVAPAPLIVLLVAVLTTAVMVGLVPSEQGLRRSPAAVLREE